jgi:tetraacyldisaccharide 4'-kinase
MKPSKMFYPLSILYFAGFLVSRAIRKLSLKILPCRVISVGNITAGGTGKTPTVIWLASLLRDSGRSVCVVSRGYKRKNSSGCRVVSDGKKMILGKRMSGDEPYLMARTLKDVPVIVGKNRYAAGLMAVEKFQPDTIVLDDGFQYVGLNRDIDVLCINALNPFGNGMLLPAGYLREPLKNIARADAFVITRCDRVAAARLSEIEAVLDKYRKSGSCVFHASFEKNIIYKNEILGPDSLAGKNVIAVSGIAVPEDFENTLRDTGVKVLVHRKYHDHYFFKDRDLAKFLEDAAEFQAIILTTSKDASRLPEDFPCYVLEVKLSVQEKNEFAKFLEVRLDKKN